MKSGMCVFLLFASLFASAQLRYRTVASGDWNDPLIWNTSTGNGIWSPAVSAPDFSSGLIAITNNVTVTVTGNITIDQTDVRPGSTLAVNDGVTVTLNNGSGNDLTHYVGATIRLFGESHLAGPGTALLAGELYVYSTNPTGAITAGVGPTGNIRTANRIFKSSTIIHYTASQRQYIGSGHSSIASVVINNPGGVELNNTLSGIVTFEGLLSIVDGELIASNDYLQATGEIEIDGGSLTLTNATASTSTHAINTLTLTNGDVNVTSIGATANCSVNFNGDVSLTNGNITVNSGTREVFCRFTGDISGGGQILSAGPNNTVRVFGTGAINHSSPFAAGSTFKLLVLDRPSSTLIVNSPLDITRLDVTNGQIDLNADHAFNGPVNLGTGTVLDFSGAALEIRSHFSNTYSGGSLQSDHSSDLVISNTGVVAGLNFLSGQLESFQLDRSVNVSSSGSLSILTSMNLLRGTFNNTSGVFFQAGATMSVNSNASFIGLAPTGGPYNLTYSGSSITTGIEAQGAIANLVSDCSGTVTLSAPLIVQQNLVVNTGTFLAGSNSVSVSSISNSSTFVAPSSTLTVLGNVTNNGTFSTANGTVIFDGGGVVQNIQGINPIGFYNLTVAENAAVSVETPHSGHSVLTISDGASFDADGATDAGRFTLMSFGEGPNQDARIAPIPATATVTGEFTVQRLISAIDNTHRFISSPVTDASVAQLQDDLSVTGNFTGSSFPCEGCNALNGPSLRWFNESLGGEFSTRYAPMPADGSTNEELLVPGRGYDVYMWNGVSTTLIDLTGSINQGEITFQNLTHTPSTSPDPATDGWHLLGNPYPSAIQWNSGSGWTRSNIDPTVWVWDEGAGIWRSYHLTTGGNLTDGIIASGQGFWINVLEGGGSMTVNENAKATSSGIYYRERTRSVNGLTINLTSKEVTDHAYLLLDERSTLQFDKGLDSYKLEVGIERMSVSVLLENDRKLSRAAFNPADIPEEIPISFSAREPGTYQFSFEFPGESNQFQNYSLIDIYLGKEIPVSESYSFFVESGLTSLTDRFVLRRSSSEFAGELENVVSYYPNPVTNLLHIGVNSMDVKQVILVDNLGQTVKPIDVDNSNEMQTQIDMSSIPTGIYFLKVIVDNHITQMYKIVKK